MFTKNKNIKREIDEKLGIKLTFERVPVLRNTIKRYKMKELVNKFLIAEDKLMPEMDIRQSESTLVFVGHLLKIKKNTKN